MHAESNNLEPGSILFTLPGISVGILFGTTVNGFVIDYLGWQWAFYIPGIISCLWAAAWLFLHHDSYESHPLISEEEKKYLRANVPKSDVAKLPFPPLLKIFTSMPFYAAVAGNLADCWGFFTVQTGSPLYLYNIQHFSLASVSLSSYRTMFSKSCFTSKVNRVLLVDRLRMKMRWLTLL